MSSPIASSMLNVREESPGKRIPVSEIFGPTIQGEGAMSGKVTNFVRTGGCGLRCTWCDSLDSVLPERVKEQAVRMTDDEIIRAVTEDLPYAPWVTLTGGDPCMHKGLEDVVRALHANQYFVAVETQGQLFPDWLNDCDQITFSPKGPSSGNVMDIAPLTKWLEEHESRQGDAMGDVCIKIVIGAPEDLRYAEHVHASLPMSSWSQFWLSSMTLTDDLLPEHVKGHLMQYRDLTTLQGYRTLVNSSLQQVHNPSRAGLWTDPRLHIGCQLHTLLWPQQLTGA